MFTNMILLLLHQPQRIFTFYISRIYYSTAIFV